MDRPIALIDMDDVVAEIGVPLVEALNAYTGKTLTQKDITSYGITGIYEITYEEFIKVIIDNKVLERSKPCEYAIDALVSLKAGHHDNLIITSRGYHDLAMELTCKWLKWYDAFVDDVIIVDSTKETKAEAFSRYLSKKGKTWYPETKKASVMFDDYAPNLTQMLDAGLLDKAVLIDRPWNQDVTDERLIRFNSLFEAVTS